MGVEYKSEDGVEDDLDGKYASNPAMQNEPGRMGPVRQPKEEVVSPREKDNHWKEGQSNRTCSPTDVGQNDIVARGVPAMIRDELITNGCEDDICKYHCSYEQSLSNSGRVAQQEWQGANMEATNGGWEHQIRLHTVQ